MRPGTVIPPTAPRMVYLTLRGISIVRLLVGFCTKEPRIVEVHPTAAMALRGAPVDDVMNFKGEGAGTVRRSLLAWLEERGLRGVSSLPDSSDHLVAACAAALAAWEWSVGESGWRAPAEPPFHPYDFAC